MVNFPVTPATLPRTANAGHTTAWADGEFSFHDLIDTINPLQHLPIIGSIYRWITGDKIGAIPRIVGDTLFGGPIGLVTSLVNVALKEETGRDVGETVVAQFSSDPAPNVAAAPGKPDADKKADAATPTTASAPGAASVPSVALSGMPLPGAATGAKPLVQGSPTSEFAATAQRKLFGSGAAAVPARQLSSTPVPLQPAGVPLAHLQPGTAPLRSSVGAANAPDLPSNPPVDVSQKMLDALDRYAKLQQDRDALRPGSVVDIAP
jgi:hypothetical protein